MPQHAIDQAIARLVGAEIMPAAPDLAAELVAVLRRLYARHIVLAIAAGGQDPLENLPQARVLLQEATLKLARPLVPAVVTVMDAITVAARRTTDSFGSAGTE